MKRDLKGMKLRRGLVILAIGCVFLFVVVFSRPKSVVSTLNIKIAEIEVCSVLLLRQSGVSADLEGPELEALLDVLENTHVQFDGIDMHMKMPANTVRYLLHFQTHAGKTDKIIVGANGYVYTAVARYRIIDDNEQALLAQCNNIAPPK